MNKLLIFFFYLFVNNHCILTMQSPPSYNQNLDIVFEKLIFEYDPTNPDINLSKQLQCKTIQDFIYYLEKQKPTQSSIELIALLQNKKMSDYHLSIALEKDDDRKKIRNLFAHIVPPKGARLLKTKWKEHKKHNANFYYNFCIIIYPYQYFNCCIT